MTQIDDRAGAPGSLRDVPPGEPWEFLEDLRGTGDVVWDEGAHAWLVTSYDLLKHVGLATGEEWQSFLVYNHAHPQFGMTEVEWNAFNNHGSGRTVMGTTGPGHDRMHRWFMRKFSPKVLAEWGDRLIEPIANAAVDQFESHGRAELYAAYCSRVTPRVTAAILGLPWQDETLYVRLRDLRENSLELLSYSQKPWLAPSRKTIDSALESSRELVELVHPMVMAKRSEGGSDFIGMLWSDAEQFFGGTDYTDRDVTAGVLNALLGAIATTTGGAGNCLYLVLRHPRLQARVEAGGAEVGKRIVEETLRLFSPSHLIRRVALRDTELGGVQIREGDAILALTAAGSRDPEHYECPADVDLERPASRDHFGFFMGPRTCAGQSLARFVMERMLVVALQRLPNLRLDPAAEQPSFTGTQQRHWRPLYVFFDTPRS